MAPPLPKGGYHLWHGHPVPPWGAGGGRAAAPPPGGEGEPPRPAEAAAPALPRRCVGFAAAQIQKCAQIAKNAQKCSKVFQGTQKCSKSDKYY